MKSIKFSFRQSIWAGLGLFFAYVVVAVFLSSNSNSPLEGFAISVAIFFMGSAGGGLTGYLLGKRTGPRLGFMTAKPYFFWGAAGVVFGFLSSLVIQDIKVERAKDRGDAIMVALQQFADRKGNYPRLLEELIPLELPIVPTSGMAWPAMIEGQNDFLYWPSPKRDFCVLSFRANGIFDQLARSPIHRWVDRESRNWDHIAAELSAGEAD